MMTGRTKTKATVSQKSSSGYEERPAPASASTTVDINLDHASELFMHHIRKIVSAQTARGDHAEAQAAKLGERVKTLEEQARDSESKYAQAEKDAKKFLDVANENIEKLQEEVRGLSRKVEETQAASEKEKEERREERKEYERILDAEIAARKSAEGSRDQAREELAALHRQNELLRERDEARAKNFEQVVSLAKRLNQDFSAALNEALEEARAVPQQELPAAAE
ncbi:hypothetical protein IE81DRAFT_201154 [Ceraceosorus guamensis]|uniref:Uncharacterized protein n=1 Tax=Ceraceosorus guamensis TaxID=1522189 RepID=A0A316VTI5_9BASI|nr:hypothetical protein IE81DRAFT_201154 [Ceraceosorus guamensis]PWN40897.1 hypothetical protein IE81DRAFT_201154 [Ceraceosorus guamensis]